MGLRRITPPQEEPVSLEEAKLHLRVDFDKEDANIRGYIAAARQWAEDFTGRSLITQIWEMTLDIFPTTDELVLLPRGFAQSLDRVQYFDSDNVLQQLHDTIGSPNVTGNLDIDLSDDDGGRFRPVLDTEWPETRDRLAAVEIRFTTGYKNPVDIPANMRHAVLYRIADFNEIRSTVDINGRGSWTEVAEALLTTSRISRW